MLKIWGRANSMCVQKVLWCCGEAGIPFERVDIGGRFGGNDSPEYRALNPNGVIPTVDDDGFVLWESNSIVRYLASKHDAGNLWPVDAVERADAERWMDWQLSTVYPHMPTIFLGLIRTPPEKRDLAAIEAAIERVAASARRAGEAPRRPRFPRRSPPHHRRHPARHLDLPFLQDGRRPSPLPQHRGVAVAARVPPGIRRVRRRPPALTETQMDYTRAEAKDYAFEHWHGCCNVILPSFTSDLKALNEQAIRHDVRRNIEQGFWGALIVSECGTTKDEMRQFMEIAVDEAAGRQQLLVHGTHDTPDDIVEMCKAGEAIGMGGRAARPSQLVLSRKPATSFTTTSPMYATGPISRSACSRPGTGTMGGCTRADTRRTCSRALPISRTWSR